MRPLKLTMAAFGPYKGTESVDFTELEQNNLFVISGNTGSGKTTIFDGICFALYGSASGTDREDSKMLRSDFADDNTHTSIELEFELNGRFYRILRQLGHVKQGNKSKTGERYEFFEKVEGKEIPCVDRQMVSEIDRKVESLIGLTQDQFKQIVMLPQGEFRKLLTSQTENKEAILRRLFKTENYSYINELLKNKRNKVDQEFKQVQQKRDHFIQSITTALPSREESPLFEVLSEEYYNVNQVVAALDEEAAFYEKQLIIDKQNYNEAYKAHDKMQTEFHQAKTLNDRFTDLDQKEKQLKELDVQVPTYAKKEKKLEEAERASHIEVYEKQAVEWRKEEKQKGIALERSEAADKIAGDRLKQAQLIYKQEESKKGQREEVGKRFDRLKDILPTVKELDERKIHLRQLENNGKKAAEELKKVKMHYTEKNESVEKYEKKINTMDQAVSQLPEKQLMLTEMREQVKVLMDFTKLKKQQVDLDKDLQTKEAAFVKAQAVYRDSEEAWLSNQASILAGHLHDGEACPVCGSLEHPDKATNQEEMVTREQLDALKKKLDEKDSHYRDAIAKQKSEAFKLEEKEGELATYKVQAEDAPAVEKQLVEKGKQLNIEVEALKKQLDELKTNKEIYIKAKEERKQLEAKKEKLEKSYQDQRSAYQTAKAVYDERLRNIPEEVRTLSSLEKELSEAEAQVNKLEKAWDDAQKKLQSVKEEKTKTTSDLTHTKKQLEETKEKRVKAEKQFTTELKNASFDSEEIYHQAKMVEADRQEWKESIRLFNENLSMKKQQVKDLNEALKDMTRVDLTVLEQKLSELKAGYESALKTLNLSKEYQRGASELKASILKANEQVIESEKELATITDLYDVLRGQNNQKISFERYLQIEYLERIIEAANGRLKRLSNGQFYLIRSDRQESHGKQSGLALDVYDGYTGQTRDVKTLSGGEKFNASLCLALGMSDVIQSFQGNISINTMFIDEGFGSLDEEALNKSIETLIDIQQSGRMIGVISHVQELKAMFPAILEVSKTMEGYSRTKFVVK
ncbi:SMC family ATPase [Virgibacillus sp. C22-A2]|uniref:Nuclease SbcCD subunit C n=1 Tax=Virgibacillus tibetensis TaxID=3042313 RepID=A0ABU6KHQ2_9BACI|nr:SMC family ATPase [Virgibacillus sp. C22-A2]